MEIENLVRSILGSSVAKVESELDKNLDGESVVRVRVVFKENDPGPVGSQLLDFSERLRDEVALAKLGFPVITYSSESDLRTRASSVVPAQ